MTRQLDHLFSAKVRMPSRLKEKTTKVVRSDGRGKDVGHEIEKILKTEEDYS